MTLKEELYHYCQHFAQQRLARIQANIQGVQEALVSETKSSAGDKHETGRAMLQLEREKLGHQLAEAEKMEQTLSKVTNARNAKNISLGSFVKTSKAAYYIAISAGEFKGGAEKVYCISAGTPIGKLLLGKSVGDTLVFNGDEIRILETI